jgi:hypothetical protein
MVLPTRRNPFTDDSGFDDKEMIWSNRPPSHTDDKDHGESPFALNLNAVDQNRTTPMVPVADDSTDTGIDADFTDEQINQPEQVPVITVDQIPEHSNQDHDDNEQQSLNANTTVNDDVDDKDTHHDPVDVLGIIGLFFAFCIPLVGLVLSIIALFRDSKIHHASGKIVPMIGLFVSLVIMAVFTVLFIRFMQTNNLDLSAVIGYVNQGSLRTKEVNA